MTFENPGNLPPSIQTSIQAWKFLLRQNYTDTREIEYRFSICLLEVNISTLSTTKPPVHGRLHIQDLHTKITHLNAYWRLTHQHERHFYRNWLIWMENVIAYKSLWNNWTNSHMSWHDIYQNVMCVSICLLVNICKNSIRNIETKKDRHWELIDFLPELTDFYLFFVFGRFLKR